MRCRIDFIHALLTPIVLGMTSAAFAADNQEWVGLRKESSALFLKRDYPAAIEAEKKALAIAYRTAPESEMVFKGLRALGTLHRMTGQNDLALQYLKKALAVGEKLKNDAGLAFVLQDLMSTCKDMGRANEAKQYEARVSELKQRLQGKQ